jgi:hypothetical protein
VRAVDVLAGGLADVVLMFARLLRDSDVAPPLVESMQVCHMILCAKLRDHVDASYFVGQLMPQMIVSLLEIDVEAVRVAALRLLAMVRAHVA